MFDLKKDCFWFFLFFVIFLFFVEKPHEVRADVGGSLTFSLTKGDSKVTPGLISSMRIVLCNGKVYSAFPDSMLTGVTVSSKIELGMSFIPGDEEKDKDLLENGELRIEGYLQAGGVVIPIQWIPSSNDYFIGHYNINLPENFVLGGYNVVVRIWSTKGITEYIIVFIPFSTTQVGTTLLAPFSLNVIKPEETGWESHPEDYCGNIYATDGSGYYPWTDAKQARFVKMQQTSSVQNSEQQVSSVSTSKIFQEFLNLRTTSGNTVKETNGFFFVTSKPFSFLTVVTDSSNTKKELFRGKVTEKEWTEATDGIFVFVPKFSGAGRVYIDDKTGFVQNSSQKMEKVGNMPTFLHDFSTYQVVEIFPKGGN